MRGCIDVILYRTPSLRQPSTNANEQVSGTGTQPDRLNEPVLDAVRQPLEAPAPGRLAVLLLLPVYAQHDRPAVSTTRQCQFGIHFDSLEEALFVVGIVERALDRVELVLLPELLGQLGAVHRLRLLQTEAARQSSALFKRRTIERESKPTKWNKCWVALASHTRTLAHNTYRGPRFVVPELAVGNDVELALLDRRLVVLPLLPRPLLGIAVPAANRGDE